MYPDAYEVGLPNQGVQILYEVLNERPDALAERTYAVWPDLEALMREHGIRQFTVDAHRPVGAFDLLGVSFSTELGYTNLLTALDLAGIPLHAADRDDDAPDRGRRRARRVQPRADRRLRRRRGARRRRAGRRRRSPTSSATGRPQGRPGGRDELLLRLAAHRRRLRPALLRRHLPARRPHRGRHARTAPACPTRVTKHTVMDLDEWPYPKTPLVPLAEIGARADERRDLPRLHPRLPLLPGRHDHPPGARAQHRRASARWSRSGLAATGFEEVGLLSLSQRRPLRDRPAGQAARRPLRGRQGRPVAAVDPRRRVQHRPRQRVLAATAGAPG